MTHFKLDGAANARAQRAGSASAKPVSLAQLRALMSDPASADTWAKDAAATAFLKEAEELIEGPPAASQPASNVASPISTPP